MRLLPILELINYVFVFVYGVLLSMYFANGTKCKKEKLMMLAICLPLLVLQGVVFLWLGVEITRRLYPLMAHLPLVIFLVFVLKKSVQVSLVSVFTAYS